MFSFILYFYGAMLLFLIILVFNYQNQKELNAREKQYDVANLENMRIKPMAVAAFYFDLSHHAICKQEVYSSLFLMLR